MKINEKMLEDWICEHPEEIFGMELLGRQVRLKHGILDVLGYRPDIWKITPIELKVKPLKEKDVGQVLRYTYDVGRLVDSAWFKMGYPEFFDEAILPEEYHNMTTRLLKDEPKSYRDDIFERLIFRDWDGYCRPMLIGPEIDDASFAAAVGAKVVILLWKYEEGIFSFSSPDNSLASDRIDLPKWTQQALRLHIDYTAKEAIRIVDENIDPLLVGI